MASNLAALGFAGETEADFNALGERTLPHAVHIGSNRGRDILRWQDVSGARLVFTVRRRNVDDVVPSLASTPGARLQAATSRTGYVTNAAVVDADGQQTTALVAALEEGPLFPGPVDGSASIVALGREVTIHADDEAFANDRASLLGSEDDEGPPRPEGLDPDASWPTGPLRMGAESFISYGVFGEAFGGTPEPHARLNGTVLSAERRRNEVGGLEFLVVRVRTAGFEADVCLASSEHPDLPAPGSILAGEVYLVGSLPEWSPSLEESPGGLGARVRRLFGRG